MITPSLEQFQMMMDESLLSNELTESSNELMKLFVANLNEDDSSNEVKLRLAIYRNNVIHSLSSALGDLYPVIKQLIGDDCFNAAAIEYVRMEPPKQAPLLHYGKGFSEFIRDFEACKHLHFLSDIAKLEFEHNQAYHSDDGEPFDLESLGAIAPEQLGDLTFDCHPSMNLLQSSWPIDEIWHENQKEQPDVINLDNASPANLLIYRLKLVVQVVNLDMNCFVFLQQLEQGKTINEAWTYTLMQATEAERVLEPEELGGMLGYLFSLEAFTAFHLNEQ